MTNHPFIHQSPSLSTGEPRLPSGCVINACAPIVQMHVIGRAITQKGSPRVRVLYLLRHCCLATDDHSCAEVAYTQRTANSLVIRDLYAWVQAYDIMSGPRRRRILFDRRRMVGGQMEGIIFAYLSNIDTQSTYFSARCCRNCDICLKSCAMAV